MANFGETLTYWYLRLNGFFPLTNFVLHRSDQLGNSADADLLAIRFRHVYEPIGGQEDDWDEWFITNGLDFKDRITALFVEVKTGELRQCRISNSFSRERLEYAIRRFGFFRDQTTIDKHVSDLMTKEKITSNRYKIAKLLVYGLYDSFPSGIPPCLKLSLSNIEQFIKNRMDVYADRKRGDRVFFPDDLIQYFAYKA